MYALADDMSIISVGGAYHKLGYGLPGSGLPAMTFIDFISVRMDRKTYPLQNLPSGYVQYWVNYTWHDIQQFTAGVVVIMGTGSHQAYIRCLLEQAIAAAYTAIR
jgi:hypothetical protein